MNVRKSGRPEGTVLDPSKNYFTVAELAKALGDENAEHDIRCAIRFEVLPVTKFPVRGAQRFRIEASNASAFARRFYAKLI